MTAKKEAARQGAATKQNGSHASIPDPAKDATRRDRSALERELTDAGGDVRGTAVRCPFHGGPEGERTPSGSIHHGDDGVWRYTCHACDAGGDVFDVQAWREGRPVADVLREANGRSPVPRRNGRSAPAGGNGHASPTTKRKQPRRTYASYEQARQAALSAVQKQEGADWREVRHWTYTDAEGQGVARVLRYEPPDGSDKTCRPVAKVGREYAVGDPPGDWPLLYLPNVRGSSGKVYVSEGEPAADAVRAVGLVGTCSAHGADSPQGTDWTPLAGREVVVLPDADEAGDKYADKVTSILTALDPPATVRVLRLPDLPEHGDAVEYVAARREAGLSDAEIAAEVEALADAAEVCEPPADEGEPPNAPPGPEPYRPFPVDALPEPVRGFVNVNAQAMGCDVSFIALPMLSALASAIGNTRRIRLKRTWDEPPILWTAIVGESGSLKSPAMEAALAPVREADRKAGKEYDEAMDRYDREQLAYDCDLKQWKNHRTKKSGGDAGEPPEKLEKPAMVRHDVEDTTAEALAPFLMDNWRGVLLARDELAGWLNSFNQYKAGKGGDVAAWLNFHGGRSAKVDRKSGQPPTLRIPRAAVSVCGGIQPGTLRRAMGFERFEDGLAARLLLAMPPTPRKRWTEAEGDAKAEQQVGEVFQRLYALEPGRDAEGYPQPVRTPLSDEGKRAWIAFYDQHNADMAELEGDLRAAWAKLEGYAARLALLVHFIRWAADDPTLTDADAVDEQSVAAGVTLTRWFGSEARRVYAMLGESDEDAERRKLVELIQRKGGAVTPRDLMRCSREYATTGEAEQALGELVDAGYGRWESNGTTDKGGRPTRCFQLTYAVDVDTTPKNPPFQRVSSTVNASTLSKTGVSSTPVDTTPTLTDGQPIDTPDAGQPPPSLDELNFLAAEAADDDRAAEVDPPADPTPRDDEAVLSNGQPLAADEGRERGTL